MKFYDRTFAAEYDRRLSAEGYPGNLVDHIARALDGCVSVIDVGAGTGFFAIPLAGRGFTVEAIEPSAHMLDILRGKIDGTIAAKIRPHHSTWEEWEGGKRDALVCLHSLYPMADPRAAIEKMTRFADRRIVLVRNEEGSRNLTGLLREMTGRAREAGFFQGHVVPVPTPERRPVRVLRLVLFIARHLLHWRAGSWRWQC